VKSKKPWYPFAIAAAIVVVAGGAFAAWVVTRVPYVVAVGTPIRHDDFLFTVTAIHRTRLPDGTAHYRVAVLVQNQAKVVDYQWRDTIASVRAFDGEGYGHDFFSTTRGSFVLRAGEKHTVNLTFDVPAGYSSANLRFWDGIFMGDAFNGGAYGKAIVPLEAYRPPFGT
jgi:hypothetical protein